MQHPGHILQFFFFLAFPAGHGLSYLERMTHMGA